MSKNTEWIAGAVFFVAFVVAHLFWNAGAAVKVLGTGCIFTGLAWFFRREISVGIESRAPSFFVRGWLAMLLGIAMVVVGGVLTLYSLLVACVFGWIDGRYCL